MAGKVEPGPVTSKAEILILAAGSDRGFGLAVQITPVRLQNGRIDKTDRVAAGRELRGVCDQIADGRCAGQDGLPLNLHIALTNPLQSQNGRRGRRVAPDVFAFEENRDGLANGSLRGQQADQALSGAGNNGDLRALRQRPRVTAVGRVDGYPELEVGFLIRLSPDARAALAAIATNDADRILGLQRTVIDVQNQALRPVSVPVIKVHRIAD